MNGVSNVSSQLQQLSYANHQVLQQAGQRYDAQRQKLAEVTSELTQNVISSVQRGVEATHLGMNIDTKA